MGRLSVHDPHDVEDDASTVHASDDDASFIDSGDEAVAGAGLALGAIRYAGEHAAGAAAADHPRPVRVAVPKRAGRAGDINKRLAVIKRTIGQHQERLAKLKEEKRVSSGRVPRRSARAIIKSFNILPPVSPCDNASLSAVAQICTEAFVAAARPFVPAGSADPNIDAINVQGIRQLRDTMVIDDTTAQLFLDMLAKYTSSVAGLSAVYGSVKTLKDEQRRLETELETLRAGVFNGSW